MKLNRILFVLALFVTLSMPFSAFAQEATPEPVPTVESPVIIEVPTDTRVTVNTIEAIAALLSAFAMGGIVGVTGVITLVNRIKDNSVALRAIEGLIMSAPVETRQGIRDVGRAAVAVGELIETVSDGQPNQLG